MSSARFEQAALILPERLRQAAYRMPEADKQAAEEIRLRAGRMPTALLPGGEKPLGYGLRPVTAAEIAAAVEAATRSSVHTALGAMRGGYLSLSGGHRLGLCGAAIMKDGEIGGIRHIGSLSLRVAREITGVADPVMHAIRSGARVRNTLVLSPPGHGKTTLLRDIIRTLSDSKRRVCVADERGEIAACAEGVPQLDVGTHTDVLDGCPKAKAALWLLRSMNPEVLALDEITDPADADALRHAVRSGCAIIATAHAASWEEFCRKPIFTALGQDSLWECVVEIFKGPEGRVYQAREVPPCPPDCA
jgi:stage III sporulation protein AA